VHIWLEKRWLNRLRALVSRTAKALMFTIRTAARSGETFGMTFEERELEPPSNGSATEWRGPTWTIPKGCMKMREEHRAPLPPSQLAKLGKNQAFVFESPIASGSNRI
jgi:hypothetical protein